MIKISDPGITTRYTVADFERAVADYVGYPYAVATNTGTAALHLALIALEVYKKEVYMPPLCFRAVYNAIMIAGGMVTFSRHNGNMPCIDVMNYGFRPQSYVDPQAYCNGILDASEALGGEIQTNYRFVCLSFNWNKPITCGSGGMVLCKYFEDAFKIRLWANQGKIDPVYFLHGSPAFNYRMNDLQATMGIESLRTWPKNLQKKISIYEDYLEAGLPIIQPPEGFKWNYWITLLRTPNRDKILRAFQENDIEARAMFAPHTREFPEVNKYAAETMCLPSSPSLTEEEQAKVIKIIKENI